MNEHRFVRTLVAITAAFGLLVTYSGKTAQVHAASPVAHPASPVQNALPDPTHAPVGFEQNLGQFASEIRYVARTGSAAFAITDDSIRISSTKVDRSNVDATTTEPSGGRSDAPTTDPRRAIPKVVSQSAATLTWLGATPFTASPEGEPVRTANYLRGPAAGGIVTGIPVYDRIRQSGATGVGLEWYSAERGSVEFDIVVEAGASLADFGFAVEAATAIENRGGALAITFGDSDLTIALPAVYQEIAGKRSSLGARFEVDGTVVRIRVDGRDPAAKLVVDPTLVVDDVAVAGGTGYDHSEEMAVAADGSIYVCGYTLSTDFPSPGGQSDLPTYDAIVVKFRPDVSGLVLESATYIGGSAWDFAYSIAVDAAGAVYVAGYTDSSDLPFLGQYQWYQGSTDAWFAKLSFSGGVVTRQALTYFGGPGNEWAASIRAYPGGGVVITGGADGGIPMLHPAQSSSKGLGDVYVARFTQNAAGAFTLVGSTYWGGTHEENPSDMAVDALGNIYVSATTNSTDWPLIKAFLNPAAGTPFDAAAFKLTITSTATTVLWSSTFKGTGYDSCDGIAVDSSGAVYLCGGTSSPDFPTVGPYQSDGLYGDAWVARIDFNAGLNRLVMTWGTYLAGDASDNAIRVAVPPSGSGIFVAGTTTSTDFPLVDPFNTDPGDGLQDGFVAQLDFAGSVYPVWSSLVSGYGVDWITDLALDPAGNPVLLGNSSSNDIGGGSNPTYGGDDLFVVTLRPPGPDDDADGDGYSATAGDCDDANPLVFPGATELCDGIDNDCDGSTDETCATSTFAFDRPTYSIDENDPAGQVTLTVVRTGPLTTAASVKWATTANTATTPADFMTSTGTLSFASGQATATFPVSLVNDSVNETDESLLVKLTNPSAGSGLGQNRACAVTIHDDDNAGIVSFDAPTLLVQETDGTVSLPLSRLAGSSGAISLTVTATGVGATVGTDVTLPSSTVTFADGQTAANVSLNILDDAALEGSESVVLTLSSPTGGAILGLGRRQVVSIVDDEAAATPGFELDSEVYAVGESGGSVRLTITRPVASATQGVKLNTAASSATTADFASATQTLTFAPGQYTAQVDVLVTADSAEEGTEAFRAYLSNPTGGGALGARRSAGVAIIDDDEGGIVEATTGVVSVSEGAGSVTLTIKRVGGNAGPVTVNWTTGAKTATATSDFTTSSGTLSWAAGDFAPKTVTVPIVQDAVVEGLEHLNLTLSSPTGGAVLGTRSKGVVAIVDDDVQ